MKIGICLLVVLTSAGCGAKAVEIDPGAAARMATRWNGSLATPAEMAGVTQIRGTTSMAAMDGMTHVAIELQNASPGGEHPWHVHRGRCGSNGSIVGDPGRYPILKIDGDGKAAKDAHLDMALPTSGDFYVNVHAGTSNMATIVACANLAPPTR